MRRLLLFVCLAVTSAYRLPAQATNQGWELLGEGYHLTGDSAVDTNGNVIFTDERKNRIMKIDPEGRISTWKEGSNGAHGIAFGPDGRFYAGQHDRKRIVALSKDGNESVILEDVQTHHLTVASENRIYFSEPPLHQVSMVDTLGNRRVVHQGMKWPRGVRASADGSSLVVNDPPANQVWIFHIQSDGSLSNGRVFCQLRTASGSTESDAGGMAFDARGMLYVATSIGLQVCDRRGRVTAVIDTPGGKGTSNVFFAGTDRSWLYVVEWDRVYRRPASLGPR